MGAESIVGTLPDASNIEEVEGFTRSFAPSHRPTPDALESTPATTPNPEPIPNSLITDTVVRRGDTGAKYVALFSTAVPSNGFCESATPVEVELWVLLPLESKEP